MRFDSELVSRVKTEIPIASVIEFFTDQAVPHDQDVQVSCDMHGDGEDRTPSAKIYIERNFVKCWGCNKVRDPITWVMDHENKSWKEAIEILSKEFLGEEIGEPQTPEDLEEVRTAFDTWVERKIQRVKKVLMKARNFMTLDGYTRCWTVIDFIEFRKNNDTDGSISEGDQVELLGKIENKIVDELKT